MENYEFPSDLEQQALIKFKTYDLDHSNFIETGQKDYEMSLLHWIRFRLLSLFRINDTEILALLY